MRKFSTSSQYSKNVATLPNSVSTHLADQIPRIGPELQRVVLRRQTGVGHLDQFVHLVAELVVNRPHLLDYRAGLHEALYGRIAGDILTGGFLQHDVGQVSEVAEEIKKNKKNI